MSNSPFSLLLHLDSEALTALEEALALAEPEGYFRVFVDEGELIDRLLRFAYRSRNIGHKAYITRLLESASTAEAQARLDFPEPTAANPVKTNLFFSLL